MIQGISDYVSHAIRAGLLPKYVYKYYRNDKRFAESIVDGTIYYSTPSQFNDPFDCQIVPSFIGEPKDYVHFFENIFGNRFEKEVTNKYVTDLIANKDGMVDEIKRQFAIANNEVGVACFTSVNDDILMWSHYSYGHTGICLKYDIEKLITHYRYPLTVEYTKEYPMISYLTSENATLHATIFGKKSNHWKYEKEIRMISELTGANETDKNSLVEVIFGCRCDKEKELINLIDSNGYRPVYLRAKLKEKIYGIDIVDYKAKLND